MARKRKIVNTILGVIIGVCFSQLLKRGGDVCNVDNFHASEALAHSANLQDTDEKLLFVGVMTAARYLDNRALAVYETWGRNVPGKITFFSSEESRSTRIPLISLIGVDDSYPPQKKSFTMLKYMHDNYLDRFEWFMRADDDVYVRTDKLETLLRSVDSRKPWFIGQTGRGNSEEFGLLSLESDENFCMGGPGIILSRETLRRIGPHIAECLENLYTTHEDVELGRCVRSTAGVSCTWSYEASDYTFKMQVILYHNQSGEASFTGDLKQKEVHRAITLHPIKKPQYMYRLHKYVKGLSIQSRKQESILLHRDVAVSMSELDVKPEQVGNAILVDGVPLFDDPPGSEGYLGDPRLLAVPNSLNRFKATDLDDVIEWDFIAKSLFSSGDLNPKRRLGSAMKEGLGDVTREVMEIINLYSKQRGRIIDFKEIYYGYWRLDPNHGVDLILDLLLMYRKYRGHKMTVPVRRHAYIQQTFTGIEVREIDVNSNTLQHSTTSPDQRNYLHHVISKIGEQIPSIFSPSTLLTTKRISFILPISGRYETFKRFLLMYEELCILEQDYTKLIIIMYKNIETTEDYMKSRDFLRKITDRHKNTDILLKVIGGEFSRAKALQHGVDLSSDDDLLFFIDVDIVFTKDCLLRIRQNTHKHKLIYFPIVYSQYDPAFLNQTRANDNYSISKAFDTNVGSWRQFGFGIVSLYKADYIKLGGFNVTISGWGFEDVNFFDIAVKSDIRIVRSVDPGLQHVFHPVVCDTNLDIVQMNMCRGSQASTYGSLQRLQRAFMQNSFLYN